MLSNTFAFSPLALFLLLNSLKFFFSFLTDFSFSFHTDFPFFLLPHQTIFTFSWKFFILCNFQHFFPALSQNLPFSSPLFFHTSPLQILLNFFLLVHSITFSSLPYRVLTTTKCPDQSFAESAKNKDGTKTYHLKPVATFQAILEFLQLSSKG